MKRTPFFGSLVLLLAASVLAQTAVRPSVKPAGVEDGVAVYFSPNGGCTDAIVERIGSAKQSLMVQAYSFTSVRIAEALMRAHQRGVKVTVILDAGQRSDTYSSATFLYNQGIATFIDPNHAIAHNKIILIDDDTIITGSFNFSKAAEESNAENLVVIQDKSELFRAYEANFKEHFGHSVRPESPVDSGS